MSNAAVERYTAPTSPDITDREWKVMERKANVLAASSVVPKDYRGKPEDIMAVALTARDLGLDLTVTTLAQFFVVEGRCTPSAQLMIGMAAQHGHEVWVESSDGEQATVCIRRRNSDREHRFTFTLEMAKQANLINKDNWKKYPEAMLIYRAATRGLRAVCPEVLLGLPASLVSDAPPETVDGETGELIETPKDADQQPADGSDDIVDAELVEDKAEGAPVASEDEVGAADGAAVVPASDDDRRELQARIDDLDEEFKRDLAVDWRKAEIPRISSEHLTHGHVAEAHQLVDDYVATRDEAHRKRQRQVNSNLNEIGIRADAERHALISAATNGETESSAHLTRDQLRLVLTEIARRKHAQREAERAPTPGPDDQEPMFADDDPGRPFS